MNFFAENLRVSKSLYLPLFLLLVLYTNLDQYINLNLETALRSVEGPQESILFWGFFSIFLNLLFPLVLISLALYFFNRVLSHKQSSLPDFIEVNFSQLLIETLRSWGKILLWSLLFLVPGVWKYLQYLLVPYVVTLDSQYKAGEVDALERSSRLVKKNLVVAIGFVLLFHLLIPVLTNGLFSTYRLIWDTPVQSLILSSLDTYVFILSTHILYNIFRKEVVLYDAHV